MPRIKKTTDVKATYKRTVKAVTAEEVNFAELVIEPDKKTERKACCRKSRKGDAAYLKPDAFQHTKIFDALFVSMGRADVWIVSAARVEIVIYAVKPCVSEHSRLLLREKAY